MQSLAPGRSSPVWGQRLGCPEIPSNQTWFITITLEVPVILIEIYHQSQQDPTDETHHLKGRKLEE